MSVLVDRAVRRSYNVVFRSMAGALALNTAEGAMTTVNCATHPAGAYTPPLLSSTCAPLVGYVGYLQKIDGS